MKVFTTSWLQQTNHCSYELQITIEFIYNFFKRSFSVYIGKYQHGDGINL